MDSCTVLLKTVYNHRQISFFDKTTNRFKNIPNITFDGYQVL